MVSLASLPNNPLVPILVTEVPSFSSMCSAPYSRIVNVGVAMPEELAWWLNQVGIIIEIAGAGYLVYCALQSRRVVAGMKTDIDSIEHSVEALLREVRGNFKNQRVGFVLLVLGLPMQLVSNGFYP